mmetsp:Transcript_80881/g.261911  ORF Transcript_80881/g.261911 Transcript_80881/m.261911 type:complete len:236 (-) Transcript_80881:262-969(-)
MVTGALSATASASPAARPRHDRPPATDELALQCLGIGPLGVEVGVVLVLLQLLLLLLLLVVVRQHGLVRVLVDPRLAHGGPLALRRQLRHDLRLLVPAHVLLQSLVGPQLLAGPPEVGLGVVEDLLELGGPVELFPVLELQTCWVVDGQPVVGWVGNHHSPTHVVDVRLACLAVEAALLRHKNDINCGLRLLGCAAQDIGDLRRRRAACAEAVLVRVRGLAVGVHVQLRDRAEIV